MNFCFCKKPDCEANAMAKLSAEKMGIAPEILTKAVKTAIDLADQGKIHPSAMGLYSSAYIAGYTAFKEAAH